MAIQAPAQQLLRSVPSRMTLKALVRGKKEQPLRVVLYGVEGIGKSTFASGAPKPIFLAPEEGTAQLDIDRFPAPETWPEVLEALRVLEREDHEYQTLVMNTLDWLEPILWAHVCERDEMKNIEEYGYGKGYSAALEEWRIFLASLERIRRSKGMHVVMLAHSWIRPFKNPEGDDFDRYEMKLNNKAAGLMKEWADAVLFSNYETFASKDKRTKRVRGVDTGARLIFTQRKAAYDAKNRYGLPDSMPLSWGEFEGAVRTHEPADPERLKAEIERKLKLLGGEIEKGGTAAIARAGSDAMKLAQLNNWANAKLAAKEEESEQ